MDAVGIAARAIKAGEADLMLAGGVESMTRAPFVMGKSAEAFGRQAEIFDTTIGWRFVNPKMKAEHGIDSMPETAENVAQDFQVARADQDAFAFRSQQRAGKAQKEGRFAEEIVPVTIPRRKGDPVKGGEGRAPPSPTPRWRLSPSCPRPSARRAAASPPATRAGVNDGACAVIVASGRPRSGTG
jgi:acetyl-CoA acyltransferase